MSAEDSGFELDLSSYVEPADLAAAWALVIADAQRELPFEVEADDADDASGEPEIGNEPETLPLGFEIWTPNQRDEWAVEYGLSTAESRRRIRIVDELRPRQSIRQNSASESRSDWGDVPIGGLLDHIAAGTLTLPAPLVGMLDDGSSGLFYEQRVNGLAGESGAGKGWIALSVAVEQMRLGRHVFYVDFEDSPSLALLRLVSILSADSDLVREAFHYIHPTTHGEAGIAELVERVSRTDAPFVVVDSTGESIAAAGKNQNHDEDVAAWFQSLAHPLAEKGGACVLLLDHLVKSEDGGLWPIGSQRKRAAITGTQLVAEVAVPFSRGANGLVLLKVAKDRHGAREARSIASFVSFNHPIHSMTTKADGSTEIVLSEELTVTFGVGKTADQVKADKDARASLALDADVAALDGLTPPPSSQRDVIKRMNWGASRAMDVLREWRLRQPGSTS